MGTIKSMKGNTALFRDLHYENDPLLIGNVWNVQSAKIFANAGFKAIATSSAAVAETLGYNDGEAMPFAEYLFIIKRLTGATGVPLSVDLEGGYGRKASQIVENISILSDAGVAGINIEDSVVTNGKRTIINDLEFTELIADICSTLKVRGIDIFINVRSDVFLLGLDNQVEESIKRIKTYEATGADGLFFPCVIQRDDIKALTSQSKLPVNVMCMPDLPSFNELKALGVKRISMANFYNRKTYEGLSRLITDTMQAGSFKPVFS